MSCATAVIPTAEKQTASLIFLHGLDDVGESWREEFQSFDVPKRIRHVKFVFPTAPILKVSKNNGEPMTSWFDIHGLDQDAKEDHESIVRASALLNGLVDEEIQSGILAERIMIGGFSMGGAVALHTGLTSTQTLAGVLALSTWLPLPSTFPHALAGGDGKKTSLRILQCHGNQDSIVAMSWSRLSEASFKAMGFEKYRFAVYDGMVHTNCAQEMQDVIEFIEECLPKEQ